MNLIEKLKEYNGNITIDQLPDELQIEMLEWAANFAQESFINKDEMEQVKQETLRSTVNDIVTFMEDE